MSNFKKADTTTQWYQDDWPGSLMNLTAATMVGVVHTTETMSWPGYEGGKTAPNYTGFGPLKGISSGQWRAHFPDERSSRALRNLSGGVETNTLNSVQIELIGTCDPKHARSWNGEGKKFAGKDYIYWPKASDSQLMWLAGLLADLHLRHGLRLAAPTFVAYPESYGPGGQRFSFAKWRAFAGVCGHQHVPENVHGDPGNINMPKVLSFVKQLIAPTVRTRLRVLNWALKVTMPEASARAAIKDLLNRKKPDVATLTEVDFTIGVPTGYRGYRTNSTLHDNTTVLLVSTKLKVIKHGYALMTEPWIGPQGNRKKPRAYPWALVEKNGKRFYVGAIHMPTPTPAGSPARVESDQWATAFMKQTGRVVLSGDFNMVQSLTGAQKLGVGIIRAEYKGCTADGLQDLGYNGSDHKAYAMGFLA